MPQKRKGKDRKPGRLFRGVAEKKIKIIYKKIIINFD